MMSIPVPKIMLHASSATIVLHQRKHFLHGVGQTDKDCAAHDAMPNVEFNQVRNAQQVGQVLAVQSVAGVDPEAQPPRLLRPGAAPIQFLLVLGLSFSAMPRISGVLAISRLSRVLMASRNFQTSRSWMCRRSSRRWAVMPCAPADSQISAASTGSGSPWTRPR